LGTTQDHLDEQDEGKDMQEIENLLVSLLQGKNINLYDSVTDKENGKEMSDQI